MSEEYDQEIEGSDLPDHMLEFTSRPREPEGEDISDLDVDAVRREKYGDFRVANSQAQLYVLNIDKEIYIRFANNSLGKIEDTIEELAEGKTLKEAKNEVYSKGYSKAADRLEAFLDDGRLPEEDAEGLLELKDYWMPEPRETMLEEMGEDVERFKEEGFGADEIKQILSHTYSRSKDSPRGEKPTIRKDLKDAGIDL